MRIVILGKYPPIQGGVARRTYATAQALVRRGHDVHVVTNACEVEDGFRAHLLAEEEVPNKSSTASVHVHSVEPLGEQTYIPWANPFSSKLFGRALRVIQEERTDLIVGWYFEPYGMVAAHLGRSLGLPYVICHAGSDIGKLARHPDLKLSYCWMLEGACGVLTSGRNPTLRTALADLGLSEDRLVELPITRIEAEFSRAHRAQETVDRYRESYEDWARNLDLPDRLLSVLAAASKRHINWNVPVVLTYGKAGEVKGSFDLVAALGALAMQDCQFTFLTAAGGRMSILREYYERIADHPSLLARTSVLPLVSPWHVPDLIAASDVVCFLERGFPIEFHAPRVPREILAAGSCLVCSREVARKQPFAESLVDGKNFVEVADPRDHDALIRSLGCVLRDALHTRVVAKHGQYLSRASERFFHPHPTAAAIERIARDISELRIMARSA